MLDFGTGDGSSAAFQLVKQYGGAFAPWRREIRKPVAGTVQIAVGGVTQIEGVDFSIDAATGVMTFEPGRIPAPAAEVTAGFEFDVPVRFDTDSIQTSVASFQAGDMPNVPVIEVRV